MRILAVFILFVGSLGYMELAAQTAMQRYFRPFLLPETWYEQVGATNFYHEFSAASEYTREPRQLRGSVISFYPSDFILSPHVQRVNVSMGMINKGTSGSLNNYRLNFLTTRQSSYMPHSLPVIYKKEELPNLTQIERFYAKTPFDRYRNFMQHPGGGDSLQSVFRDTYYTRQGLMRRVFYESPQLVRYDWHELPDPPRVFRSSEGLASRSTRESIERYFNTGPVQRPERLQKVDLVKSPWKFSGTENIQFSQAYLRNWVRGGQNSIALLSDLRFKATYTDENTQWENNIIHKLGIIASEGSKSRTNDDLLDLSSKYGINASQKWFYSLLFNFRTQFFNGYLRNDLNKENPISAFMAPAYFSLAAGMDYKEKDFTLMLSPLTSRLTVVLDTAKVDQRRYNIPEDKRSIFLTGGSLQNNFTWNLSKEIKLTSAMNIFYDYFAKDENIQAEWDMILDMYINVFLSTRIVSNIRYFESESSKLQIRESLSIAFRYNF